MESNHSGREVCRLIVQLTLLVNSLVVHTEQNVM